jgi:CheY-like chemotaxis protein
MNTTSHESLAGTNVLVVEDMLLVAQELAFILKRLGCTVVGPVSRLAAALPLVQSEAIDVALLDVNLGGEDVRPLVEALVDRDVPFIFVTGYSRSNLPSEFRDYPYVEKPFGMNDLADKLLEATARSGSTGPAP